MGVCLCGMEAQMQAHLPELRRGCGAGCNATSPDAPPGTFALHILGKGPNRLNMPPDLEPLVALHRRLRFNDFYEVRGEGRGGELGGEGRSHGSRTFGCGEVRCGHG